ncbi:hypothetical protein [Nocardia carnea]|uniref:hypothetical protein n=1 Tax=Nocardia carnea TaxID=37328 RepID=UPI002456301C|nr:hypothetical protein [Nocardia carnea]
MMNVTAASIVKNGREKEQNADRVGAGDVRFALADGASDAAFPEIWAELLVWSFLQGRDPFEPSTLSCLRWRWWAKTRPAAPGAAWYSFNKVALGSAATFVGLTLDTDHRRFTAAAIGDACLLHLRRKAVITAGPLNRGDQFTRTPKTLTTHAADSAYRAHCTRITGEYLPGDQFVLASDALAKYLLTKSEHGLLLDLTELGDGGPCFEAWVAAARAECRLDNDDTSFCLVEP